jgi:hypothetical protein
MSRIETTIPAVPRGAQRFMDWYWPLVSVANITVGANFAPDLNVTNRAGATDNTILSQNTGGAGATCNVQYQNGRPAVLFNAGGAGSSFKLGAGAGLTMHIRDLLGGPSFNGRNPQQVFWRFQYVIAFSNNATNSGVTIGFVDSANPFVAGARAGVRICTDGANLLDIQARRTSGALLSLDQPIAGSDARNWNHIDIRWGSANNTTNGFWRILLNNTQVGFWDLGGAAIMPLSQDGVNRLTLNMMWGVETGGVGGMYVALPAGIRVSGAYSEAALL